MEVKGVVRVVEKRRPQSAGVGRLKSRASPRSAARLCARPLSNKTHCSGSGAWSTRAFVCRHLRPPKPAHRGTPPGLSLVALPSCFSSDLFATVSPPNHRATRANRPHGAARARPAGQSLGRGVAKRKEKKEKVGERNEGRSARVWGQEGHRKSKHGRSSSVQRRKTQSAKRRGGGGVEGGVAC